MDTRGIPSRKNPAGTSNFLSSLFFGWTAPIFWKGARRGLRVTDLYGPLKSDESERLGDRLEREWKKELKSVERELELEKDAPNKPTRQPNLKWAIARMFWAPYMMQGVLLLILSTVLQVMQPVLQDWVIGYFNPDENLMTRDEALFYAGSLIMTNISVAFITHHNILQMKRIGMCVRAACCSIIYRKVLRLDQAAVNKTAAGLVANLISNDVARFDMVFVSLHYLWIMPIQLSLIGYVMWESVGVAALAGIGTVMIQAIPIQGCLSSLNAKLRSKIAPKTDERVQLMSELISGIQVVKMYSWENPFGLIVSKVRASEMKVIGYTAYLKGFCRSIAMFSSLVTLYLTLITFSLMGNSITAEIAFVLASLFQVVQMTCYFGFPQALISAGEAGVSLKRLTQFLLLDEVKRPKTVNNELQDAENTVVSQLMKHGVGIELVNVAANWVHGQLPHTLCDISMEVKSRSLCAIVGPTGSGKSSLLHLLLSELPAETGKLLLLTGKDSKTRISSRDIRISYTSQDSWLFSATIRENILFGEPYDERRYQEVTRVCALLEDFNQLPQGDLSFAGERGAALSGGQKARVNLARAVYRDAELYLLDDPLSAVDPRVGRHLFEECITGFLKGKTRILVTHQLQYLRHTDHVVVLNRGTVERQGTYEELAKSRFHISDSAQTEDIEDIEDNDELLECKTPSIIANDNDQLTLVTDTNGGSRDIKEEEIATGNISSKVYWGYISAGGNLCSLALLVTSFIASQIAASGTDYFVTYWTNQETLRVALQSNKSAANNMSFSNCTEADHREMHLTEWRWFDEHGLLLPNAGIYVYTICIISCFVVMTLQCMLFMRMCLNASRNVHNSMFANLLHAPMRFFNTNPAGRILNRFSKDVGVMDEQLPEATLDALQIMMMMIAVTVLVIFVNNVMIIPAVIIGAVVYVFSTFYLKTAQDVMRLEGITKSPVFSHVSSTLDGLTTIRSRGPAAEGLLRREFDQHQDAHTGAWYIFLATAAAFGLMVDLILCAFTACICFSFILMDDGTTLPGFVGLAIFQSLLLTGEIQFGVRQCVKAISHMSSVERLIQYTNLPKEGPLTIQNPPPSTWPSEGGLDFKDVSMRYADNKPPVLKNLNLTIRSGWKVGIVGRTGAGKSSLISALFRLSGDGLEGEIVLDGIDTKSIGLHELRPRISIIPQEPILFSASLRHNLDPFERYSDAELWDSLREVELSDVVSSLDFQVARGGANFSVGQRQLICLARAILRNNRLLVLDEATANIDQSTDALIQTTIRRKFADCTVLTIAHRLDTVMDNDRVLVMSDGCIMEFGHPHLLLKNRDGHFFQMLQQTGKVMAEKLAGIAETAFLLTMSPEVRGKLNDGNVQGTDEQSTHS